MNLPRVLQANGNTPRSRFETWFIAARLAFGLMFVSASVNKILQPGAFADLVANYQILPNAVINPAALILPWLELILGVLILCGIWLPGAVLLGNLLMLTFTGAMAYNVARGLDVYCGCFTTEVTGEPETWLTLIRDVIFLIPGMFLLYAVFRPEKKTRRTLQ